MEHSPHRAAGAKIAEAMLEANRLYVRFVSVGLITADPDDRDVFLCHGFEDKEEIVHSLGVHLESRGIHCWFEEAEIAWGERIVGKIQGGLARARYVVVLSAYFLRKSWPQKEWRTALMVENEWLATVIRVSHEFHISLVTSPRTLQCANIS